MIVVVEGVSAAGKTTYARLFGDLHWLPEIPAKKDRPDREASAHEHAQFWADHNATRFQMAQEIEREHGFVICDTDPLKLHYSWCMGRAGFDWPDRFHCAQGYVRRAIAEQRLGFADLYLVREIEPEVARNQKENDTTRRRGNFEQHLALQPHLMDWFAAMAKVLPGRVEFAFPPHNKVPEWIKSKTPGDAPRRFDVSVFDALIERLPK